MKPTRKKLPTGRRSEADRVATATSGRRPGLERWLVPTLVVLLTVAVFFPALQNGFVDLDDYDNLLQNPHYRGLSGNHLRWMFTTFYLFNYRPLTWVTFGLDYILWGMNPFGYHLTSLLLHAANSLLFYFLALRLLSLTLSAPAASAGEVRRIAAGFAALIFSIHPLRVQPVAWLSARSHLLSSLFFLGTILCYLRATVDAGNHTQRLRWLIAAVVLYTFSLLSQPSGIALPLILGLLDIYPLRRLGGGPGRWFGREARRIGWEKTPFLLLALTAALIGLLAKQSVVSGELGMLRRLALALYGLAFYGWKTVVPLDLSPIYQVSAHFNPWEWPFLFSGLGIVVLSLALFAIRHRWPAGLASWACYTLILIPYVGAVVPVLTRSAQTATLNELEVGPDRYSYLACLPWAVLAGAGIVYGWRVWLSRLSKQYGFAAFVLASTPLVAIVAALMSLTWKQTLVWHDSERLWRYALSISEGSSFGHNNLGIALSAQGKLDEAIAHFRRGLELRPEDADLWYNLGNALAREGKLEESVIYLQRALQLDPQYADADYDLGNVRAAQGKLGDAVAYFRAALRINPAYVKAHNNVGTVLVAQGKLDDAMAHFREAVRIDPGYATAHHNLGLLLAKRQELGEAIEHYRQALRIQPEFAQAHESLARALAIQGRRDEAMQHYQEALRLMKSAGGDQESSR